MYTQPETISWRKSAAALVALLAITAGAVFMPRPTLALEECCTIVQVDRAKGLVMAKHLASGRVKTFSVKNQKLLSLLKPGMTYGPKQVSGLSPQRAGTDCCNFAPTLKGNVGR
jgi:hypothetical protein